MNYVIRCAQPKKGESPRPRATRLVVYSRAEHRLVLESVTSDETIAFLSEKAAERERSLRMKEVERLARMIAKGSRTDQLVTNPLADLP